MDVQCESCKTEYEFDDALVSGRGTTVRCTHCGHQFKVRRPDSGAPTADRWVVRTATGQQLTFLTLRELQRAILAKRVTRNDTLLLGEGQPRPLGSITELEPFFDGRASSGPPSGANTETSGYHAPAPPPMPARPQHSASPHEDPPTMAGVGPRRASFAPPGTTAPNPGAPVTSAGGTAPPAPPVASREQRPGSRPPEPRPSNVPPPRPKAASVAPARPMSPLPPPTVPVRRTPEDELRRLRATLPPPSIDEPFDIPRRRRVGGWVVALVLLMAVGVMGWVLAKPYLVSRNTVDSQQLDARAQTFLKEGEKAMSSGDLEAAQQAFDKASALAERDPRVAIDEARVAAARADIPWLTLRLLPSGATDEARTTKAQLDDWVARARKAADEAIAVAPDEPAAVRAMIDALRLQGDGKGGRSFVAKLTGIMSQPETAYVLAALDLAEPAPLWTTVLDRLHQAEASDWSEGRARAALVYALAKSGDMLAAKTVLARLDEWPRPYPCLPMLHAYVERATANAPAERSSAAIATVRADANAPPRQPLQPAAGPGWGDGVPADQASAMRAASQAIKKADYARARRIYETLAVRNPNDSEALAGVGDVMRSQGDMAGAIASYKRALSVNPSYLPALLGVADTEWASGDRSNAERAYKDIVDRFPEGTYPSHVKPRAEPIVATQPALSPAASAQPYDPGDGL